MQIGELATAISDPINAESDRRGRSIENGKDDATDQTPAENVALPAVTGNVKALLWPAEPRS